MSTQDPIADMLVRIKNAQAVSKKSVSMPKSSVKVAIAAVLQEEGYVSGFSENEIGGHSWLTIDLKYHEERPVITRLTRISCPSLRVYKAMNELPVVDNGLGVAIVSTSKGVMTAANARQLNLGGEVLCVVS